MSVDDFRVSHAVFEIVTCSECNLKFTRNVPGPGEIGVYYKADSYDSHRLDNNSLISRLYRLVRRRNVLKKLRWLKEVCPHGVVADYGCGLGHFVAALKEAGFDADGYEIDKDVRDLAKQSLDFELNPLETFHALAPESLDVITMWHVLEHVYFLNEDFASIVSKLKSGGHIIIAVPNHASYDGRHYGKFWEAYDVPRHLYHFDRNTLVDFVSKFDLKSVSVKPMVYDSYYVAMRSEVNKNGSMLRGLWVGFVSNLQGRNLGYSSHAFVFKKQ